MPKIAMGRKNTATTGSTRVADSSGLRVMLHHQQSERSKRQSKNEHESNQIGMEKPVGILVSVQKDANAAGHQADNARHGCALLQAADTLGRHVVLRGHFAEPPPGNFARTSGGSSETGA